MTSPTSSLNSEASIAMLKLRSLKFSNSSLVSMPTSKAALQAVPKLSPEIICRLMPDSSDSLTMSLMLCLMGSRKTTKARKVWSCSRALISSTLSISPYIDYIKFWKLLIVISQ